MTSGLSAVDVPVDRDSTTLIGSVSNQDIASEGLLGSSVPNRSSSNSKLNSSIATPMNSQTTDDQVQVPQSGSPGSVKAKKRSGSIASSKRSRKEKPVAPIAGGEEKSGLESPETTVPTAPKPKKRGVSKFLSFLNCCSAPDNANPVELEDQAVPAKKTKVLQTNRNRQGTPATKANASAAESSAGESKEGAPENIGGPPYSEITAATKPTMSSPKAGDSLSTEKPALPAETEPVSTENNNLGQDEPRNQPLPPLPPATKPDVEMEDPKADLSTTSGVITPPEPLASSTTEQNMLGAIPAIDDRTPQQKKRDSDVQMVDAPPIVPEVQATSAPNRDAGQVQLNLPPPPPRSSQDRPAAGVSRTASNGITPNENQKWLLPPLQPRFKGKKCLVLDLDETLVHSSFKVRVSE